MRVAVLDRDLPDALRTCPTCPLCARMTSHLPTHDSQSRTAAKREQYDIPLAWVVRRSQGISDFCVSDTLAATQ
jgi:hypothetical protein